MLRRKTGHLARRPYTRLAKRSLSYMCSSFVTRGFLNFVPPIPASVLGKRARPSAHFAWRGPGVPSNNRMNTQRCAPIMARLATVLCVARRCTGSSCRVMDRPIPRSRSALSIPRANPYQHQILYMVKFGSTEQNTSSLWTSTKVTQRCRTTALTDTRATYDPNATVGLERSPTGSYECSNIYLF
jgi:hypothetical protein